MKITTEHFIHSTLKEVVNIGGGNAATSLSKLINQEVKMDVPTLELMEYEEVFKNIRPEEMAVKVVLIRLINGEGSFVFVTEPEDAKELSRMMFSEDMDLSEELIDSAVKELVNILVNSFLNATMKILNIDLIASVPAVTLDMFGSVLTSLYMEQSHYDSKIIIIKNEFWSMGEKIEGSLYFVPNPEFIDKTVDEILKMEKEMQ